MGHKGFFHYAFKKFRATVITDIWLELLIFTGIATAVTCVSEFYYNLGINNQLLTVLGIVISLVVSFRTSSAYDRYWEGRKLWSAIALASKNLTQVIWLHVPHDRPGTVSESVPEGDARLRAVIEKRTMICLVQAFSVSVKHLLRGEPGIYYEDLYPLVSFLPRYAAGPKPAASGVPVSADDGTLPLWWISRSNTMVAQEEKGADHDDPKKATLRKQRTFDPERALPQIRSEIPLRPARNPPKDTFWDYFPIFVPLRWIAKGLSRRVRQAINENDGERELSGKRKYPKMVESNIPLEICLFLSSYLAYLLRNNLLQAAQANAFVNQLQSMQDSLENLQRVRNTPIPFAYQVHLRMTLWIYLTFLPFQIYGGLGWVTIPATLFASFLYLGFLEIGQEIENPFCYDANDLDVDGFCLAIQRNIHEVTTHAALDPAEFVFSSGNQPFAPYDRRAASELTDRSKDVDYVKPDGVGTDSLRKTFVKNWREVNEVTRERHWKDL